MKYFYIIFLGVTLSFYSASAQLTIVDSDSDGLSDDEEVGIYKTNPLLADTDNDGYLDGEEVKNSYSPLDNKKVKISKIDTDKDGLNDALELILKSNLNNRDSDSDGVRDGLQFYKGLHPQTAKKLKKVIKVDLKKQSVEYFTENFSIGKSIISSGKKSMPTPSGTFKIVNKSPKAWSKKYGLWMPYWMGMQDGKFGFHELPEWPNGYKEGQNHLGTPVSHGCIRLGIGDAKKLYDWTEVGTEVIIK